MSSLAARAEVVKLARELSLQPEELEFLQSSSPDALRAFRREVMTQLDAPYRQTFALLAKATGLIPNSIAAKIATRYFGPLLCGKVAAELDPERASKLIGHFPVEFLADTTGYIDPDAATSLIRGLDTEIMVPPMKELLRRKDYVTLARFMSAVTEDQLRSFVPLVETGEDLLMTAFNAEVMDRFEVVLADLPVDRIQSIMQAAVDNDQFVEALTFMQFLSRPTLTRVADATSAMGPDVVTAMIEAAHRADGWAELIPVVSAMSDENLKAQAGLDLWDDDKLTACIRAARSHDLWDDLRRMVGAMDDDGLHTLAALPPASEPDVQAAIGDLLPTAP
ncbi:hypothetical protein [Antrihabitans cavernicola]|uniref:Uncharacterized protein n=1 Tax=Antrihabitans cavernicola TaxID=2495913 RepID=A0A5A7SD83_9NOCA|nr:hypothetical protein [Spelaeibacter cavernicola]KAA0023339.1 hypothetical protein FOY51_07950 [Spelaeibacter cavernicola]